VQNSQPKQGRRRFGASKDDRDRPATGSQPDIDQTPEPYHGFEHRIGGSRRSRSPDRAIESKGAKRQPSEKPGDGAQHRHHVSAKRKAQLARPHDLIAEAREAGRRDDRDQRQPSIDPPAYRRRLDRSRLALDRSRRTAFGAGFHRRHR